MFRSKHNQVQLNIEIKFNSLSSKSTSIQIYVSVNNYTIDAKTKKKL